MYGLQQAGRLAHYMLTKHLNSYNFHTTQTTPELWTHSSKQISFVLCVDDFGIKYENKIDFEYLSSILQQLYPITVDITGQHYCGLTLHWEYNNPKHVDINMPSNDIIYKLLKKHNINLTWLLHVKHFHLQNHQLL